MGSPSTNPELRVSNGHPRLPGRDSAHTQLRFQAGEGVLCVASTGGRKCRESAPGSLQPPPVSSALTEPAAYLDDITAIDPSRGTTLY